MKKLLFFITLIVFVSCKETAYKNFTITDGVSAELALYRKLQVSNVKYDLSFLMLSQVIFIHVCILEMIIYSILDIPQKA